MRRVCTFLLLAALAFASARAEQPLHFTDTPAAKAFQAGRFEEAVAELLRLRETNPDNLLVLRYLAMSYDRLGRYNAALLVYIEALSIDPENIALLYHSGETLYRLRYADDARRHFQLVLAGAPESEYAALARQYLDAITYQVVARRPPGEPERISLYAEVVYAHDDYRIPGAPGEPDQNSRNDRITEYLSAELNLVRQPRLVASIDFSGYGAQYVRNRDTAQDIWQYGAGATLQYSERIGRTPAVGSLRYVHQEVRFDGGPDYSESDGATIAVQLGFFSNGVTRVYYRYTSDRFENDGFDAAFSSRDAELHAGGLQQTIYLFDRSVWFTASAAFQDNQAEGLNYDFDGPTYSALVSVPLVVGLRLDVGYEYAKDVYRNFTGPTRRETERHEWSASLYRWIGRSLLVRARFADIQEDSTLPGLSYDRTGVGVSAAYVH